jgi:hypothetical protein
MFIDHDAVALDELYFIDGDQVGFVHPHKIMLRQLLLETPDALQRKYLAAGGMKCHIVAQSFQEKNIRQVNLLDLVFCFDEDIARV